MSNHTDAAGSRMQAYLRDAPVIGAMAAGAGSYVVGFVLTYLLVTLDSGLDPGSTTGTVLAETRLFQQGQFVGFPQPEPTATEFAGWIFYNAHFVDTVLAPRVSGRTGQGGAQTQSAPEALNVLAGASTQIPTVVYQLVPVVVLATGGYALARAANLEVDRGLVRVGLGIPTTYVPLGLVGAVVFQTASTAEQNGIQITVTASPSVGLGLVAMAAISTLFGIVGLYLGAQQTE